MMRALVIGVVVLSLAQSALANRSVTLKNTQRQRIDVWIRATHAAPTKSWRHLVMRPCQTVRLNLEDTDTYVVHFYVHAPDGRVKDYAIEELKIAADDFPSEVVPPGAFLGLPTIYVGEYARARDRSWVFQPAAPDFSQQLEGMVTQSGLVVTCPIFGGEYPPLVVEMQTERDTRSFIPYSTDLIDKYERITVPEDNP